MNVHVSKTRIAFQATIALTLVLAQPLLARGSYDLHFSTYIGGAGADTIRDICADNEGNVYIAGGTTSTDFPTTAGAYQRTQRGSFDIFVTKFDGDGKLLWSTLVGGQNYDLFCFRRNWTFPDWLLA